MKAHACPLCGAKMKRNGRTSSGRTRWRCTSCGSSTVRRIDNAAKLLDLLLSWLSTGKRQADMPGGGRTFRRKTARFWEIRPMLPKVEAPRRVVYVDGIHLGRKAVADSVRRRERPGMAPREDRELPRLVSADDAHRRARGRRFRRRRRPREGTQEDMPRHAPPELRLPSLLAGIALYHDEA